ncbi:MAG: polysaccharide deacetylase family protein [Promethearchaeota archaeon]
MALRQIVLTFDVENDCSLESFKGIELGLPKILRILEKYHIPATFFVTGEVAEIFPKVIRNLGEHHEVGCHGYYHESLKKIDSNKFKNIKTARRILKEITDTRILGFRAPFLQVSQQLLITLKKAGFEYDSSILWFKFLHWHLKPIIKEFWLMFPNVLFRFPLINQLFKIGCLLNSIPILYFHPWEGVDVRNLFFKRPHYFWNLISRPDRWLNSGASFISLLSRFIRHYLYHGFKFRTLRDVYFNSF